MAHQGLGEEAWQAIRQVYEFDADEPGFEKSAQRASEKFKFAPPTRQAVYLRAREDAVKRNDPWQRKSTLNAINQIAQRKADALVDADGQIKQAPPTDKKKQGTQPVTQEESEDVRAQILVRHRTEWRQVASLRQEALAVRKQAIGLASELMRLAKAAAETTKMQQDGERKAWGMEEQGTLASLETIRLYLPDNGR